MLHGAFVNGRYTSTVLFVLSMLVFAAAYWLPVPADLLALPLLPPVMGMAVSHLLSALLYILAAIVLSKQAFFDSNVKWKGALYLWFVALSTFVGGNAAVALAALLFLLSFVLLLFAQYSAEPTGPLFSSFLLLGVLAFIMPCSLLFIPLFLLFCSMTNILSVRGVAASILGLLAPFWIVMGTAYVLPDVGDITESFIAGLPAIFDIGLPAYSLLGILQLLFVLVVLLPAIVIFMGGSSPAKPSLHRRLSFVIVAVVYMLLLCFVVGGSAGFFYICQLPFVAVLASYILARKESKILNLYIIILNLIMIAIATYPLWWNN